MDRADTITAVGGILGDTFTEGTTDATWDQVLARSVLPDDAGRWPGSSGYVDNYDPDWAAAELVAVRLLQAMTTDTLVEWSSEGSRFKSTPAELSALEQQLRGRSIIATYLPNTLERLDLPRAGTGYDPRSGGWPDYARLGVITNRD